MRVTGGALGGRGMMAPAGDATRPTTDRVREALFAVLGDLQGLRVADLFAGSGALGIEALSRGAECVCFVEQAATACRVITKNVATLGLTERTQLWRGDVARARRVLVEAAPFDLILCDPPWGRLAEAMRALARLPWGELLSAGGRLCLEHPARAQDDGILPTPFAVEQVRRWGDTAVTIWVWDARQQETEQGT